MTALVLDPEETQFNYDHSKKTKPLKSKQLWKGRWSKQKNDGSYQQIDLAKSIRDFYMNGNTNLSQGELISGTPNTFKFK